MEADGKTDVTAAHAAYAALRVLDRATWIVGRRPINLGGVKKIVGEVQIYYPDGVQGVWAGCPRFAALFGVDKKEDRIEAKDLALIMDLMQEVLDLPERGHVCRLG